MNFASLLGFILFAAFYFFSQYFKFKNNLNKIGNLKQDFKFPNFKKNNLLIFALIMLISFILFEYLLSTLYNYNFLNSFLKLVFYGVIFSRNAYNRIIIGDKGFYFYNKLYYWNEIEKLEWDKDIKQTQWGLKIYPKNSKIPSKLYFDRNIKEQLEIVFNEH